MDSSENLAYWERLFLKHWRKHPQESFARFACRQRWITEDECHVKEMGEDEVARMPVLQQQIYKILRAPVERIPIRFLVPAGLYHLKKDWVLHGLKHDPAWAYLNTPQKRTDENFHSLNEWLDEW